MLSMKACLTCGLDITGQGVSIKSLYFVNGQKLFQRTLPCDSPVDVHETERVYTDYAIGYSVVESAAEKIYVCPC